MKAGGQRVKGRAYEQRIAALIRAKFPGVQCHRSSQADRAYDADIVCTGHPMLERLWLELSDARKPQPRAKLEQAERDIDRVGIPGIDTPVQRLAVVVWHRLGEQTSWATMRLGTLDRIRGGVALVKLGPFEQLITLDLVEFLELLR